MIAGADEHAATPMTSTTDRLNSLAIDCDPGIFVSVPTPTWRSADRLHHSFAKHDRQGLAIDVGQTECEQVDSHIVVFEMSSWGVHITVDPLLPIATFGPITPVWFVP